MKVSVSARRFFMTVLVLFCVIVLLACCSKAMPEEPESRTTQPVSDDTDSEQDDSSSVSDGITIKVESTVNDGYYAQVSFSLEGEGTENILKAIGFADILSFIEGEEEQSIGIQYSAFNMDNDKIVFFMDFALQTIYQDPDYHLDGKKLHLELRDIQDINDEGQFEIVKQGKWIFDIQLEPSAAEIIEQEYDLPDLGYMVNSIEISPLSVFAKCTRMSSYLLNYPVITRVILNNGREIDIGATSAFIDNTKKSSISTGRFEEEIDMSQVRFITFAQESDPGNMDNRDIRKYDLEIKID